MTALQVAQHLNAKKIGRNKWTALCPAHEDRKPSLTISEGKTGVLLSCMSHHCDFLDIVRNAGLKPLMLRYDYNPNGEFDKKAYAALQAKQEATASVLAQTKRKTRALVGETRCWETVASLLHAHLVHARELPEGPAIARLWRKALATARDRHGRLWEFWPAAPEIESYHLTRCPRELTRKFTGPEIADVLGLD
jgi:hypothetical protein